MTSFSWGGWEEKEGGQGREGTPVKVAAGEKTWK